MVIFVFSGFWVVEEIVIFEKVGKEVLFLGDF